MSYLQAIVDGSMKAAALLCQRHNITPDDAQVRAICDALTAEIKAGAAEAVREAAEAQAAMGDAMALHALNVSCNLFAVRALKACGLI